MDVIKFVSDDSVYSPPTPDIKYLIKVWLITSSRFELILKE